MAMAQRNVTSTLLMPKATAVWLIENTALSFHQIADFTSLTEIEVEALANEDIGRGLVGRDPIDNGELTQEELDRCQADPSASLKLAKRELPAVKARSKGPRYTPVSKRADKPDAIAYILKYHSDISDAQITKLVGTTKATIEKVRDRSHPNTPNMRPRHPADLGLCSYQEFEDILRKALKAAGKDPDQASAQNVPKTEDTAASGESEGTKSSGGFDFSNFLPDEMTSTNTDTDTNL